MPIVLSSWHSHYKISPGHSMNADSMPGGY